MNSPSLPAQSDASPQLRVGVDVRCLVDSELRGFSRYTDELLHGLLARPAVSLVGISDRAVPRDLGFPVEVVSEGREFVIEQRGFRLACAANDIDVLFCPTNRGLPAVGVPSVLTLHDAVEWDPELVARPTGRSRARFGYAAMASLAGATRIVTVSRHAARQIRTRLGIAADRIQVVTEAPGRRFLEEPPPEAFERVRRTHELPTRFGLYVGGYDPKKSVDTLLRAWALLDHADRPALVLAGKRSPETAELEQLVHRLGLTDNVRFVGYVDDVDLPVLYRAAEVFVFPAIAEGFGLPPLEAMASGTPTVVADAGALPEVVGGAALRFPGRDHVTLAGIVRKLLDDPGERARLGAASRTHARARDWHDVATETEAVLRSAASTSAGRRIRTGAASLRSVGKWIR